MKLILPNYQKIFAGTFALVTVMLLSTFAMPVMGQEGGAPSESGLCKSSDEFIEMLSSGGTMTYFEECTNYFESLPPPVGTGVGAQSIVAVGPNTRINSDVIPASGNRWTQSEVSIDSCNSVVAGYNDSQGTNFSGFSQSQNDGSTWTDGGSIPNNPNERNGGDPAVKADSNCRFYYATLVRNAGPNNIFGGLTNDDLSEIGVAISNTNGVTFGGPVIVESSNLDFLDKEYIGVGPNPAGGQDIVHITYTRFVGGGDAGGGATAVEIVYERSLDGGATWVNQFTFNPGGSAQGSIPVADPITGTVYVFYKGSRDGDGNAGTNVMRCWSNTSAGAAGMWVACTDVGVINRIGNIVDCDINRRTWNGNHRANHFPTAAVSPNGDVYVSWNQSPVPNGGTTDIVFFSSSDGGTNWNARPSPQDAAFNDNTDQFEPWMDVTPNGEIKIIWYDRRNDASQNLAIDVFATTSNDAGQTWDSNTRLTTNSFTMGTLIPNPDPGIVNCYFVGEYNGIDTPNNSFAHVAWGDGSLLSPGNLPQPDVFYSKLIQQVAAIGGEFIGVDTIMVLVAGTHSVAAWMIPVIVSGIGITIVIARKF
ncbi:MAG: exo-alpha-sialidase [Thaumarchaeota archaeon]|nr:exo-alpha-sialidase [Nitrososphaerota archaeon]